MKISLEALQLLDAIEVRGSFAAAAEALHRVPSALTHAVRRLETDLGLAVFERTGRRAVLTPAGRALLEEGRHLLRAAGDLECRVKRIATGWETELRIAVDRVIDATALLPLVAEFDREASGTRLRFSYEVLGGCWDALVTGRADLAIGASGEAPPGGGWIVRPLGHVDFAFAVAPHHPLAAAPEPLAPQLVAQYRGIAIADTSRALLARTTGLLSGQDVLTVPDPETKLAAQAAGLGVGYLPAAMARREAAAGRLVIKRVMGEKLPVAVHLAWRGDHEGRALAWFAERLDTAAWRARLVGEMPEAPVTGPRAATRKRPAPVQA